MTTHGKVIERQSEWDGSAWLQLELPDGCCTTCPAGMRLAVGDVLAKLTPHEWALVAAYRENVKTVPTPS